MIADVWPFHRRGIHKAASVFNSMTPRLSTWHDLQQVWKGTLWGKPVAVKLLPLLDVDERQLECLRREVAVLLHTTGECKQVSMPGLLEFLMLPG